MCALVIIPTPFTNTDTNSFIVLCWWEESLSPRTTHLRFRMGWVTAVSLLRQVGEG